MIHQAPYQELRNSYWQYLTGFKNNHGYMNRSHTFDNFNKFLKDNSVELDDTITNVWNWYFV